MSHPSSSQTRPTSSHQPPPLVKTSNKKSALSSSSNINEDALSSIASSPAVSSPSSSSINVEEMRDFMKTIQEQLAVTAAKAAEDQRAMIKMMLEKNENDAKNEKVLEELRNQISVLQTKPSGTAALNINEHENEGRNESEIRKVINTIERNDEKRKRNRT